jgi:hypothetical protein
VSLKSVTITGESVSNYAFYQCKNLKSVTIAATVTSIGKQAFVYCSALRDVYITDVAAWCNISFGDSYANPLVYAKNLYVNNELVTKLVIPNTVTKIPAYAFYSCDSLTSVEIPKTVKNIGAQAFAYCANLTKITFAGTVDEWNAIVKVDGWNTNLSVTEVICDDGVAVL